MHEWHHLSDRPDCRDHGHLVVPWSALMAGKSKENKIVATDTRVAPVTADTVLGVQWGTIVAGAVAASALALVLHTFATAIGLSVSSTSPTWRDTSFALVLLSGLYLVVTALASYALGGYIAARLRSPVAGVPGDTEFRDGMHGLVVWAVATLLTGLIALAAIQSTARVTAPATNASASVAGENLIAYDLDRLFRSDRRPQGVQTDIPYTRSEAARILLTASSHRGLQADDRAYLVRLVSAVAGLAPPDAERRVDDVIARTKEDISRARRTAVIVGFMIGTAALIGALAAWYAACAAGRMRDGREEMHPLWDWSRPISRL